MKVESVSGIALGLSRPGAIRRVVFAVSLAIAACVALLLPTPAANAERIVGTDGDDHIVGTSQADDIRALLGDDEVSALRGRDSVHGGPHDDRILGGAGSDSMIGGRGSDELHGERGDDFFHMDRGADTALGGPGRDLFQVEADGRPDRVVCGPGIDEVIWNRGRDLQDQAIGCEREIFSTRQLARMTP
jgi:Ca2+-binding RTX toxin-like protein